ncbi:hypothetical protein [Kribbella sp. HUAS MG21]|uniref:DUF3159 domain-containing protein n=1 Tax=Kribbella sp. HUAS MG21 TaxID=3160966 RepID=A0AAU7T7N0_9ACTN
MPAVVAALGALAALAGAEHGIGELTQPSARTTSVVIESWPHVVAFEPLNSEPAMTLIPDLRVSGVVTIVVSLALGWWAARAQARRHDAWVLLGLSVLLLLVGGGFGPPLLGVLISIGLARAARTRPTTRPAGKAQRALAGRWRELLVVTVSSYLALFPGVVLLRWWTGFDSTWLSALLPAAAFTALAFTLMAALANDRTASPGRRSGG